ncbi:signal peptidase II [Paenibacillus sp. J2TS4]|uniref:signal peptidase II n=1 Tax=Paenibacillus sp. J2TS4 TaxID=2807194 RepID=UPI001B2E83CB|nr:signal peptidase II [Paenibacillus sp. J2TS4]GIP36410.1 lipoprotein signal peptidase [Paenibacillus sp. J2TS4]
MIYYFIALIVLALDHLTKWLVVTNMKIGESRSVIGEFFQFTSHRNKGAAFGILQNQRWFFLIITTVVVIGIIIYMRKVLRENKKLMPFALSLLLGGAVGNFIDRALTGEVVDFLDFTFSFNWFGQAIIYPFPIFNIADSAIVIGVSLILLDSLLEWRKEKKGKIDEVQQ